MKNYKKGNCKNKNRLADKIKIISFEDDIKRISDSLTKSFAPSTNVESDSDGLFDDINTWKITSPEPDIDKEDKLLQVLSIVPKINNERNKIGAAMDEAISNGEYICKTTLKSKSPIITPIKKFHRRVNGNTSTPVNLVLKSVKNNGKSGLVKNQVTLISPTKLGSNKLESIHDFNRGLYRRNNFGVTSTPLTSFNNRCANNEFDITIHNTTPKNNIESTDNVHKYTFNVNKEITKNITPIKKKKIRKLIFNKTSEPEVINESATSISDKVELENSTCYQDGKIYPVSKNAVEAEKNARAHANSVVKLLDELDSKKENLLVKNGDEIRVPVSPYLLQGVVAFIDYKCYHKDKKDSPVISKELLSLGAKIRKSFTKKVTHCFFLNGSMATYSQAIKLNVPIVDMLWIEGCKAERRVVPVEWFQPTDLKKYEDMLQSYKIKMEIKNRKRLATIAYKKDVLAHFTKYMTLEDAANGKTPKDACLEHLKKQKAKQKAAEKQMRTKSLNASKRTTSC